MKKLLPQREFQPSSFRIANKDYSIKTTHGRTQFYQRSLSNKRLIFDSNWMTVKGTIAHTSFSGDDYFAFIELAGEDGRLCVYQTGIFRPKLIFQTDNVFRIAWGKECIFFSRIDSTLRCSKV